MMKYISLPITGLLSIFLILMTGCNNLQQQESSQESATNSIFDPLPSWNNGNAKQSVIDFVTKTTMEGSADFIPVSDRIACFDNDGTLWNEQPVYAQFVFAFDRAKAMAPEHPEWKTEQPFKALLEGDMERVWASSVPDLLKIVAATQAGMTTEEFEQSVTGWMDTAVNPNTGRHYNQMIYQPMVELLNYLRDNGYKTFIVSGSGIDFMRPWTEKAYGIPPDQVIGSSYIVKYEIREGQPVLFRLPEINFVDDKEGKPIGIHQHIGKRPVFTAGNSDGDYAMLQWTSTGPGPRFGMIVHHTDSIREVAYDSLSSIGHLQKGLNDAAKYNWVVVDMKENWKEIYPLLD